MIHARNGFRRRGNFLLPGMTRGGRTKVLPYANWPMANGCRLAPPDQPFVFAGSVTVHNHRSAVPKCRGKSPELRDLTTARRLVALAYLGSSSLTPKMKDYLPFFRYRLGWYILVGLPELWPAGLVRSVLSSWIRCPLVHWTRWNGTARQSQALLETISSRDTKALRTNLNPKSKLARWPRLPRSASALPVVSAES